MEEFSEEQLLLADKIRNVNLDITDKDMFLNFLDKNNISEDKAVLVVYHECFTREKHRADHLKKVLLDIEKDIDNIKMKYKTAIQLRDSLCMDIARGSMSIINFFGDIDLKHVDEEVFDEYFTLSDLTIKSYSIEED